jgi:hypothetical protein
MILLIILLLIAIIILCIFWCYDISYIPPDETSSNYVVEDTLSFSKPKFDAYTNTPVNQPPATFLFGDSLDLGSNLPTMHSRCQINTCGGDLVCDLNCNRCKKNLAGDCSTDIDCNSGLYCHNWQCAPIIPPPLNIIPREPSSVNITATTAPEKKSVKWDDTKNEIFFL